MKSKEEVKAFIEKEFYHVSLADKIRKKTEKYNTKFGRGQIYQSLPLIDLEGQRPTDVRIKTYRIEEILRKEMDVLDIGCNIGFFDMSIADKVHSVKGVEYNAKLVKISNKVVKMLDIDNVTFESGDFNKWFEKNKNNEYDVILSFAVHYWLGVTPESYSEILNSILKPGGYLFFESQNLETVDSNFEDYISAFNKKGMSIELEGIIKDDDIIQRRWLVFKKEE